MVFGIFSSSYYAILFTKSLRDRFSFPLGRRTGPGSVNFASNAKFCVIRILKSDFTSQNTVRKRGLGGGASLSDYSETWHLLVDCQSGPLPISTHCVMVVIGIGLGNRWCKHCSPRAWAFVGANTQWVLERIARACPERGHAKPLSQSTLGER